MTDLKQCRVTPKERGPKKADSFLFLVNTTSSVLSGLTDRPVSPHQVFMVWRTHGMCRDDIMFGNFPSAKRNVISVTLSINSDPIEPRYQIIHEAPQEWRQHAFLRNTGHHNPSEWIIKGRYGQAALHGSFNPLDSGVAKPMSDKIITHGVKRGVVKTPIAVSCWNHELMKGCLHGFLSLVSKLVGMQWHQSQRPVPLSTSLCMVLSRSDVRLMGLKSLGQVQELIPGLSINSTLSWRHVAGT